MTRTTVLLLTAFLIFLVSCQGRVSSFQFTHKRGTIDLKEKPGVKSIEEGRIPTPTYMLAEPYVIEEKDQAFSLLYSATGKTLTLSILADRTSEPQVVTLPTNQGQKTEARVGLDPGTVVGAFQVDFLGDEEGTGELFGAGIDDDLKGIRFYPDHILQCSSVGYTEGKEITIPVHSGEVVVLEYEFSTDIPVNLTVSNTKSGEATAIELKPSGSGRPLYLYEGLFGYVPDTLSVIADDQGGFRLLSAVVEDKPGNRVEEPLPADFTTVLNFNQEQWRRTEFELFSWNAYPEILIFDAENYAEQARLFKRLAFFVEKEGYIGRLLSNEELKDMHGWNAHDYRADDLALFYQTVETSGFSLNEEEEVLRGILIDNGILVDNGGSLSGGNGGVISISRQSPDYLRRKFIIHEGTHGVFFTDSHYREACFALWEALAKEEKALWRLFFAWNNYFLDDRYLMANEYQAYLLQQPASQAESYFRNHRAIGWIRNNRSADDDTVRLLDKNPGFFEIRAQELDAAFFAATGFQAGDLFSIELQE